MATTTQPTGLDPKTADLARQAGATICQSNLDGLMNDATRMRKVLNSIELTPEQWKSVYSRPGFSEEQRAMLSGASDETIAITAASKKGNLSPGESATATATLQREAYVRKTVIAALPDAEVLDLGNFIRDHARQGKEQPWPLSKGQLTTLQENSKIYKNSEPLRNSMRDDMGTVVDRHALLGDASLHQFMPANAVGKTLPSRDAQCTR